jgi:hypothetical protein
MEAEMNGLIKSPIQYLNVEVSLDLEELAEWMEAHGLTRVSVYVRGFVCNYVLMDGKAKEL